MKPVLALGVIVWGCATIASAASIHLLTGTTGSLRDGDRMFSTNNTGLTWTEINPAGPAFFLDASHGWMLRGEEIARTNDAGKTWLAAALPLNPEDRATFAGKASLHFADQDHGWAMLRRASNSNFSLGMLFATNDGGASWQRLPDPPLGDPVRFTTATDGWLAGGPRGDQLYVTRDGGQTWQSARLEEIAGPYHLQAFDNASDGILAVGQRLYQTHDGGRTWQLRIANTGEPAGASALIGSHIVTVSSTRTGLITTELDGHTPTTIASRSLSPDANVIDADFITTNQGWILTAEGHCEGYKTNCGQQHNLWATTDGGATYQDITPPALRMPEPDSTVDGSGEGFDLCSPTVAQLQAWYTNSPYRYVNVYIGGTNAACTQPNLSQSWVNQVTAQGWGLIPTWVGLQAPCSSCSGCSSFSSTAATAGSQGVSEAQSAAATMSSIGLAGTVVYYDLEQYNANSSCSAAASAFVNGWVQEMHALGYTAGVYGAPSNANSDWLNIANSPDAVWIALWNGVASVQNLSPIPNTDWANHQRIHQYNGGVNQTYGGVTLNVDQDYLDGPVSTTSQTPGFLLSASPASLTVVQGASGTSTVTASVSNGFNSAIALSASGLPAGATASLSPSSIAAPGSGTSTVTINVGAATAVGTYAVTVTGTGGGLSESTSISLIVNPGGNNSQLVVDGGFESATATGNSAPGWTGATNISGHDTIQVGGAYPHSGVVYAYLGDYNNQVDTLTQTVAIPSNVTTASLTFWVNVVTTETTTTNAYDFLYVEIHNSAGTLLATPLTLSNLSSASSNNTNGMYVQPSAIDLASYAGQTINLVFHATTNASNPTVFRLDDVSLLASTSGGTPDFSISAAPTSLTIQQGASGTSTLTTAVSGGFNSAIALTASGLPSGATATFSPSSIAAPGSGSSTMTVKVGSSTSTGTYNVAVTATGGGISQTASVSLTVSASGGTTQLIADGGFESATASGNSAPGWTSTTNVSGDSTIIVGGSYPHTGNAYAYLGAFNSVRNKLTQTIAIPANVTAASLTFWVNVVTPDTTSTAHDFLHVEIHNSAGALLATPLTLSNLNAPSSSNTNGVYFQPAAINLAKYAGQTIKLVFHATTNATLPTTFRIDDVSLLATP